MAFEVWLTYAVAAMVIVVIPGPTSLAVATQALAHGRTSILPLVFGVTCGDSLALLLSMVGLGALLATSSVLFNLVKWIGAAYLIYLGVSLWRSSGDVFAAAHRTADHHSPAAPPPTARSLFLLSFVVTTFNPKGIVFFIAFLPQFVNPAFNVPVQLFILAITFVLIGSLNALLYALFSDRLRLLMRRQSVSRWVNRCGGAALFSAAVWTATVSRGQATALP